MKANNIRTGVTILLIFVVLSVVILGVYVEYSKSKLLYENISQKCYSRYGSNYEIWDENDEFTCHPNKLIKDCVYENEKNK